MERHGLSPQTWSYRIGALLVAIAVLPLLGAGWFAFGELRSASAASDQATAVETDVERLLKLTELRTRLLDERNWISALYGMEAIGLNNAMVASFTGIDVSEETTVTRERVDSLVDELQLADVADRLSAIRADGESEIEVINASFAEVEAIVADDSEVVLDRLLALGGVARGGGELINGLRVLEATTVARQAMSAEFSHFFGAQFSAVSDEAAEIEGLIAARDRRHAAERTIGRIAPTDSLALAALSELGDAPSVVVYETAADDLIERRLDGPSATSPSLQAVLNDLGGVATQLKASSTNIDLYFDLVNAAVADVSEASSSLASGAERRTNRAIVAIVGFAIATLISVAVATRIIARPVRRLSSVARGMGKGSPIDSIRLQGPAEVREAIRAMNEASQSLQLAEQQARALADGDLEAPILTSPSPGRLGSSLQEAVATLTASMQERERFRLQVAHDAAHDSLTRLANRRATLARLQKALDRAAETGAVVAVLFIDLDGFKQVNDQHGHLMGDSVLREVGRRLSAAVRRGDHVGRIGGDEFLVIAESLVPAEGAPGNNSATIVMDLANRLVESLGSPFESGRLTVRLGASIGVALSGGGTQASDLLRNADLAVYKAKADGRGRVELFDEGLRAEVDEQADMERALTRAIENDELMLLYQPIVKVHDGDSRVQGLEVLARWQRPGHGLVYPGDFVPFAERSGLIVLIDRWVVRQVAEQLRVWNSRGVLSDVALSLNVSGRHLASPTFVDDLLTPFAERNLDVGRVVVEITESALTEDLQSASAKLQTLRARGMRIAIDDFGTGYTSLALLKALPIDIIKIDRSFTCDTADSSLVQLIIDTGHLLGASITAEGIETAAQAKRLADMGSDRLQGYYFGLPSHPDDLPSAAPAGRRIMEAVVPRVQ